MEQEGRTKGEKMDTDRVIPYLAHDLRRLTLMLGVLVTVIFLLAPPVQAAGRCGDGIVQSDRGEQCDDGNTNNRDNCLNNCRRPQCGNGIREGSEECDNGSNNSDTEADACRTNCVRAACGDSVADSREKCDGDDLKYFICTDFSKYNGGRLGCNNDCGYDFSGCTYCGDGEVNHETELCDDGNNQDDDGCNANCKPCTLLSETGNIEITEDTELCSQRFKLDDYGHYGTITIARNGVTLDCDGAVIIGEGRGIGIYVLRSHNVTIKNCEVRNYDIGIKIEDARNVTLTGNYLCNNRQQDIELVDVSDSHGQNNACKSGGGWQDDGQQDCTQKITVCRTPAVQMGKSRRQTESGTSEPAQQPLPRRQAPVRATTPRTATQPQQPPPEPEPEEEPKPRKAPDLLRDLLRQLPSQ